jgi:hypothetical protein
MENKKRSFRRPEALSAKVYAAFRQENSIKQKLSTFWHPKAAEGGLENFDG